MFESVVRFRGVESVEGDYFLLNVNIVTFVFDSEVFVRYLSRFRERNVNEGG